MDDQYRKIQEITTFLLSEKKVDQLYLDALQSGMIYEILNWQYRRNVPGETIGKTDEKVMEFLWEIIIDENSTARSKIATETYNLPSFSPIFPGSSGQAGR